MSSIAADLPEITASYNYWLVGLSVLIAILSSYVSLDLSGRVTATKGFTRLAWLSGGGIAMGTGIWSMHYTGMLAYRLPMRVLYHVPTVVFSLSVAIVASLVALMVINRIQVTRSRLAVASLLMGSGIVTMHYTGMAAMRMAAMHHYRTGLFTLSVALGVSVSAVALWLTTLVRSKRRRLRFRLVSSLIMGLAIPSVHYTGMAAIGYTPCKMQPDLRYAIDISALANISIVLVSLIVLISALLTSIVDRWLSGQAHEIMELQEQVLVQNRVVTREAERVRLLLDSTVEGIAGLDPQCICTFCNQAALQQLGYVSDRELIGRDLHALLHRHVSDGGSVDCTFSRLFSHGQPEHVDGDLFYRSDGTKLPVELWLRPIRRSGTVLGAVITFWDATKRNQAEEAQNRSEQLFRSIAENTADLIAVVDKGGARIYNNPAYYRVFGYTPEELKGSNAFEQIHPDDRSLVKRAAEQALRTGVGQIIEYRMQRRDGGYVSLESHGSFIRDSRGEIEGLVISARDIGPRKLAAQAEKLGAIGQLAAGIAHEINTPVQFVSDNVCFLRDAWSQVEAAMASRFAAAAGASSAETATRVCPPSADEWAWLQEEVPKAIAQSMEGTRRISKIVGAMRKFSHSGDGSRELVNINEALDATLTVVHNQIKLIATVETDFQVDLPQVQCFPDEMNQVFLNLIINAAHAIKDASKKTPQPHGRLTVRTRQVETDVQVEIEDNGPGIPQDVRPRIFEPFFTTKQVGEGTGQGLAICHDIVVTKHQGRIWFDTEVGKGTTFVLRIPISFSAKGDQA